MRSLFTQPQKKEMDDQFLIEEQLQIGMYI
jgi:hypothetical protein